MVTSAGEDARPDRDRVLNPPRAIEVKVDAASGAPHTICEQGRCQQVERVQDEWLVETEWWRPRPSQRHYYQLLLTNGAPKTVYQDLVDDLWYAQPSSDVG